MSSSSSVADTEAIDPVDLETQASDGVCSNATVNLPSDEILRLTMPPGDPDESERDFQEDEKHQISDIDNKQQERSSSKSPNRKSADNNSGKKKTKSPKNENVSDLKRAVRNEKKSVDMIVAAAIENYGTPEKDVSQDSSLKKTRISPKRVKENSSSATERVAKDAKKKTVFESVEKAESKVLESQDARIVCSEDTASPSDPHHLPGTDSTASLKTISQAGAIAVFPSNSEHETRRRSVSNPNRISDVEFDEEAPEEVCEPQESEIIDAVATRAPRFQNETSFGSTTRKTASTLDSLTEESLALQESGTVTAKAISSETYYKEIRRQLQEEAVAAVAVVSLNEDGQPAEKPESEEKRSERKDIQTYAWIGCGLGVAVVVVVIIFLVYRRRFRQIGQQQSQDDGCDDDMNCVMDTVFGEGEVGQYWRTKLTRILPRVFLEKLLQETDYYSSPTLQAFYFIVNNAENLYGVDNMEFMAAEDLDALESARVNIIFSLVALYAALNGDEWHDNTNWLRPDIDFCEWHGVQCNGDLLSKLNATQASPNGSFQIAGPPPGDLDDDNMQGYNDTKADNAFSIQDYYDSIQDYYDSKAILGFHTLDLSANNLVGSIPDEIMMLTDLTGTLDLSGNIISGTLPDFMGKLFFLEGLNLSNNKIDSTIPSSFGKMRNLRSFDVSNNDGIKGKFDDGFLYVLEKDQTFWRSIENLQLHNTWLLGSVPEEFCDMVTRRREAGTLSDEFSFRVTCERVDCPCCTECCKDLGGKEQCWPIDDPWAL